MRICDWSSDVCSSYLNIAVAHASFQKAAIPIYPVPGLFFRIDAFAQYSGRIKTHGDCGSDGTDGIAMRDDEGSVGERLIENRQLLHVLRTFDDPAVGATQEGEHLHRLFQIGIWTALIVGKIIVPPQGHMREPLDQIR